MYRTATILSLSTLVVVPSVVCAVSVRDDEQAQARRWVLAKFAGVGEQQPYHGHLTVSLKSGRLLKNMATTKVYHLDLGALPLRIADKQFERGLYCASVGDVVVHLPSSGKTFSATFGVDSNRVTSFYSNAGRGRVIGSVNVGGQRRFQSEVMREGMAGVAVQVPLGGATELSLHMEDAGGGVVEHVDFNQADWADAKVTLDNGKTVWLGDLPIGPLRANYSLTLPFSFRFDGQDSSQFLRGWSRDYHTSLLDQKRRQHVLIFDDPQTSLQVRCVGIEYLEFPVMEWKLFFKNASDRPTPILENIQPLDLRLERNNEGEFLVHHSNGSPHSLVTMSGPRDYEPRETSLPPAATLRLGSKLGLPASQDLPFFNVQGLNSGVIFAIGWPGQWNASLQRDKDRGLHIMAGQEQTHFRLRPGEEVRSPLIAMMFWEGGDWIRAQNLWRRWMIAHNLPRAQGKLPPPQHAAGSSAQYIEVSGATEQNQLMFIKRYLEEGIKPDYWWIDAGWYNYKDYWLNVGTWEPNSIRFPRGLSPISDFLHSQGMKMILWFSPEHVTRGSWLDENYPQWLLKRGGASWWMGHALFQGEVAGHVNDSGLTLLEDVAAFGMGNPDTTITGKTSLADGKWHLITATRSIDSGVSQLRLFVDGNLDASGTSPNTEPLNSNDGWGVGRQHQTRGIVGDIDDVRIYDKSLSPQDVAALFRGRTTVSPKYHYTLDGTIRDDIGNLQGQLTGSQETRYVSGRSSGQVGQALRFGNDYGVTVRNTTPNNFTLSCWVRMDEPQPPPYSAGNFRLFNLGNQRAVEWLTEHVTHHIKEQGLDLYRHDGPPPLKYWRANDAEDRQGISEIRHVEGYLRYWDELRRRHPRLRSDICSGGGSRNELESLRRAVPLWRSDYAYETTGMQTLTYGMSLWIPYFGTGTNEFDRYSFRSQMAPAIVSIWDLRRRDADYPFLRKMLSQWRQVADYYYGDFYPLTSYRIENDVWMAWQFNRPELGEGMVQAFRRPQSPAVAMRFSLRGLDDEARYSVTNFDTPTPEVLTGAELQNGLLVTLTQPRDAALIVYKRIQK